MYSVTVCSAEPCSAKSDVLVSETGGSRISRMTDEASKMTTTEISQTLNTDQGSSFMSYQVHEFARVS
jgi:hypothetical protein